MALTCGLLVILVEGASLRPQLMHSVDFLSVQSVSVALSLGNALNIRLTFLIKNSKENTLLEYLNFVSPEIRTWEEIYQSSKNKLRNKHKMIPDTESACQTPAATYQWPEVDDKFKNESGAPENEAASVTAWSRYQHFLAVIKSRGGKFNRKSMIDAMFRGTDLVYSSKC